MDEKVLVDPAYLEELHKLKSDVAVLKTELTYLKELKDEFHEVKDKLSKLATSDDLKALTGNINNKLETFSAQVVLVNRNVTDVADHETRIRVLEESKQESKTKLSLIVGGLSLAVGVLINLIMKLVT